MTALLCTIFSCSACLCTGPQTLRHPSETKGAFVTWKGLPQIVCTAVTVTRVSHTHTHTGGPLGHPQILNSGPQGTAGAVPLAFL